MITIIGIDPGLSGALAVIRGGEVLLLFKVPTIKSGRHHEYDEQAMRAMLLEHVVYSSKLPSYEKIVTTHAFIERAQAMPGQGVTSMFSIGLGFGTWRGLLAALQIPYQIVHPRTWQKTMLADVNKDDTGAASIIVAHRLFPGVELRKSARCTVDDHNMADALNLAEYGRRILGA